MKKRKHRKNRQPRRPNSFNRQIMENERAFLNPKEWGIDLRPIFAREIGPPETDGGLNDQQVADYLRRMIELCARYHLCLDSTNHMTDRQLYAFIMEKILPEPLGIGPHAKGTLIHHDCCPVDDFEPWLRYYADDEERALWKSQFKEPIPEKAVLVSNRDAWIHQLAESCRHQPLPKLAEAG